MNRNPLVRGFLRSVSHFRKERMPSVEISAIHLPANLAMKVATASWYPELPLRPHASQSALGW
jgi:hypothetical protein